MNPNRAVSELEEARRRAEAKRRSFAAAADALKSRVEEDSEQVSALVVRARSTARTADEVVRRYRWVAIGAAFAFGATIGRRRSRNSRLERMLASGENVVYVKESAKKKSLFGALLGAVVTAAAKSVVQHVVSAMDDTED